MKSFLGNFYRHLSIFIWSHCFFPKQKKKKTLKQQKQRDQNSPNFRWKKYPLCPTLEMAKTDFIIFWKYFFPVVDSSTAKHCSCCFKVTFYWSPSGCDPQCIDGERFSVENGIRYRTEQTIVARNEMKRKEQKNYSRSRVAHKIWKLFNIRYWTEIIFLCFNDNSRQWKSFCSSSQFKIG